VKGEQQDTSRWTGNVARPLQQFLHTEAGSSSLLLLATIVALVWANSPLKDSYVDLWHTKATIGIGSADITEDLQHWVNDGLMVFFFYVVALEIRWELALGELRDRRAAAVPALAALGGMVVPALLYVAINAGGEGAHGWGIVMATDIAFVLGALALMGPGLPSQVRVFLLTLAIVDDIGAIVVIAIFFSHNFDAIWFLAAITVVVAVVALRRLGVMVACTPAR
jgi:Na+/H+ antiporter NhaA